MGGAASFKKPQRFPWSDFRSLFSPCVFLSFASLLAVGSLSEGERLRGTPVRILLIEDKKSDVRIIKEMLKESGMDFELNLATSLADGVDRLADDSMDVVLLDLNLPDSDGIETAYRIQLKEPEAPVIILTGIDDKSMELEAIRTGAYDYIVKGQFAGGELQKTIYRAIERRSYEKLLIDSERKFRKLMETSCDAVLVVDMETGALLDANERAGQLLRVTTPEIAYPPWIPWHEELHGVLMEEYERRGRIGERELYIKHRDRGEVPVEVRASVLELGGHRIMQVMLRDISERKAAEGKERKALRALRTITAAGHSLVHITEEKTLLQEICDICVEEGGYRFAWVGYAEPFGEKRVRPVAFAGLEAGYLDIANVTWDESERGRGPTGTAIRTGEVSIIRDTSEHPDFKPWRSEAVRRGYGSSIALPLMSHGGSFGALNIYATEPESFDSDEVELLEQLAEDLAFGIETLRLRSEHMAAEEALFTSEERYRTVFETTGTAMCTCFLDQTISASNDGFLRMTGYGAQEVRGKKKIGELVRTDPPEAFEGYLNEALTAPARLPEQIRVNVLNRRGTQIPALASIGLMPSREELLVSLIDITVEKEYEDILADNAEQLREFLIVAAHELRHPITIIAGYSEILTNSLHQITPQKLSRINDSVQISMRRLEHILNDLLDIAHIEKGLTIFKEDVDLHRAVRETVREFAQRGFEAPSYEVEKGLTVQADVEAYKRVLTILVDNAIKFSPPGAPVEIQADSWEGKVRVSVLDRGPGVPASASDRIFERFYQEDVDHHTVGLGIGLYIAREIAKAHDGNVWYEPREGGGSIFRFVV